VEKLKVGDVVITLSNNLSEETLINRIGVIIKIDHCYIFPYKVYIEGADDSPWSTVEIATPLLKALA
jgi:hypothetical protein